MAVWIVASAASGDAVLNAMQGLQDARPDHAWLWGIGAAGIFALVAVVERLKHVDGD